MTVIFVNSTMVGLDIIINTKFTAMKQDFCTRPSFNERKQGKK